MSEQTTKQKMDLHCQFDTHPTNWHLLPCCDVMLGECPDCGTFAAAIISIGFLVWTFSIHIGLHPDH